MLGTAATTSVLFPGQVAELITAQPGDGVSTTDAFMASILIDPLAPTFHECRADNNASQKTYALCIE